MAIRVQLPFHLQNLAGSGPEIALDVPSPCSTRTLLKALESRYPTLRGAIFDVAVDLRKSSPTFGKWVGVHLSAENKRQLWIPEGFAHGFLVLSEVAEFLYKATDYYAPQHERCIIWNDPDIGIDWPQYGEPSLSPKDAKGGEFNTAEIFP